jgi:transcriptional regulator with XRE-family HTH domain
MALLTPNPARAKKGQANPVDVHVGRRIRTRRIWLAMSQAALGEAIGVTFQQIQKYEKGSNRVGASRLQQLATALAVQPSYFFEGVSAESKSSDDSQDNSQELEIAPEVMEFAASDEGRALIRGFSRIGDLKVRNRIVMLIKSLGEHDW